MRILLVLPLIWLCFAACQKANQQPDEPDKKSVYVLEELEFFLAEDDRPDSTLQRLDTLTFINTAMVNLPDTTFYPFAELQDTVSLVLATPQDAPLLLADSIGFRRQTIHTDSDGTFTYSQFADSIHFAGFQDTLVTSQQRVQVATTISPTARTKYQLTGEYWHIRYRVSFRAHAVQPNGGVRIPLEGKVHYSTVAVSAYEGQTPTPQATILIASDLD